MTERRNPEWTAAAGAPARLRVKLLGRTETRTWLRQFPAGTPRWGRCDFSFDPAVRDYDWLVVYDDLPPLGSERFSARVEVLACPRRHTLLVTTEPSSIKTYGSAYTRQFGHVLTSQVEWALPHPHRVYAQPALQWFYGLGSRHAVGYDELLQTPPWTKHRAIATVCSTKQQTHTLHNRRYEFTLALKQRLPELDLYGHGVREMDDKAESLRDYRYHIAIENHRGLHHWTEKLADPFLGLALPFYYGCTNTTDYFPAESFIAIDIDDIDGAAASIRRAIRDNEYERRLPYLLEARRRVIEEYNLFAVLSRLIEAQHRNGVPREPGAVIESRRASNRKSLLAALCYAGEKARNRLYHRFRRR
ncbi:MAG: glycosyltransferase family 10 [Pseudomonadota bacterium]